MNLNPSIEVVAAQVIDHGGNIYATDKEVRIPAEKILFAVAMGSAPNLVWHLILEGNWRIVVNDADKLDMQVDNPIRKRDKKNAARNDSTVQGGTSSGTTGSSTT